MMGVLAVYMGVTNGIDELILYYVRLVSSGEKNKNHRYMYMCSVAEFIASKL